MSTKKNDIIELLYTGYTHGSVFDSNIEADLKAAKSEAKAKQTIIVIGQKMVPRGLDAAIEGKEEGKEYKIDLKAKDAFGERDRTLLKTIPMKVFTDKQIMPKPGMAFIMDEALVKVVAVSGGRVITDFNNPLAGKDVTYKYII
ncbi:MAG: FKBP-type peptidyl-prolyl cis-trans isomerase, partial [archaeon]